MKDVSPTLIAVSCGPVLQMWIMFAKSYSFWNDNANLQVSCIWSNQKENGQLDQQSRTVSMEHLKLDLALHSYYSQRAVLKTLKKRPIQHLSISLSETDPDWLTNSATLCAEGWFRLSDTLYVYWLKLFFKAPLQIRQLPGGADNTVAEG